MRVIAILVLLLGIGLAGGAIYFASTYFSEFEARMAQQGGGGPKTVNVIVAKVSLPVGTVIDPNKHLRWAEWPEASLPPGVFTDADELLGPKEERDESHTRRVIRQMEPGEPILESKVTGFGESGNLSLLLAEGMRAFTIRIDAISGVGGFIAPGDSVDVILTRQVDGTIESRVILEAVEVIAVDHVTNVEANRPRNANTATVQVRPKDAQKLTIAQQIGRLSLFLRGVDNQTAAGEEQLETIDARTLFGEPVETVVEEAPEETTTVRMRRAGQVTGEVQFPEE